MSFIRSLVPTLSETYATAFETELPFRDFSGTLLMSVKIVAIELGTEACSTSSPTRWIETCILPRSLIYFT